MSRKRSKNWLIALALAVALLPSTAALANNPKLDEAVKSYKDRKYSQSLNQFKVLHDGGMCNELVHYYMALNYQSLNQITSARKEYATVVQGRSPSLKANAQSALNAMSQWSQHRAYEGNGNIFQRSGSGSGRPQIATKLQTANRPGANEINFEIPAPQGSC